MRIKKAAVGNKVKVVLYDRWGKKKDSDSEIVYSGDEIKYGMSARDACLTTKWGSPVRRNYYDGMHVWTFWSGATTLKA